MSKPTAEFPRSRNALALPARLDLATTPSTGRCGVGLWIALATAAMLAIGSNAAWAVNIFVNGTTGVDPVGCVAHPNPGAPYKTIQKAVNCASPGDVIIVAAGTYAENVAVPISITLRGANAGACAANGGARGPESIIDGGLTDGAIALQADNITVDGFKIIRGANGTNAGVAMFTVVTQGCKVLNNIITDNAFGIAVRTNGATEIACNLIEANNQPGLGAGNGGIYSEFSDKLNIHDNEFDGHTGGNPILLAISPGSAVHSNLLIQNNNIHDTFSVYVLKIMTGTISGNKIMNTGTGISFASGNTGVTVTDNFITGNARGIRIEDDGYGFGPNSAITINHNDITGNSTYGVGVFDNPGPLPGYTGTLDAKCNWWNSIGGPDYPPTHSNPGADKLVTPTPGGAAFSPWLNGSIAGAPACNQPPEVSITDVTQAEGNSGKTLFNFLVTLSASTTATVTVDFATADGSAKSTINNDYQQTSGTLTFSPGQTSKTVTVSVNGDNINEANETFFVNLSNPTGFAVITDGQGLGTITNDDPVPTLSIDDVTHNEGNSGKTPYVFTVTLSGPTSQAVTVDFTTVDGTARVANNDYQPTSGTLTFLPKTTSTTQPITVSVNGDVTNEDNEAFTVQLSGAVGATISDGIGVGIINNDDSVPTVSINSASNPEGNSGKTPFIFTVSLSNPTSQAVTVGFGTADGTATVANNDYQPISGTVTIPAKGTSTTVTVSVNGDLIRESDERFFVNLSNPTNATIGSGGQGIGTIQNDDTAIPAITVSDFKALEGNSGKTLFVFPVVLSSLTDQPVTVQFRTVDGTATVANNDYQPTSGTLTIPPKTSSGTVTVSVNGDLTFESQEAFLLQLFNPTNATINGSGFATGTINNDDSQPSLSINDISKSEGNSGTTSFVFTVLASNPSDQPITVNFATADGSATVANNDYTSTSGVVTIPAKTTSRTVTVSVNGDTKFEGDETFFVNLSGAVNASIGDAQGVGTILNDDAVPTLNINNVTAAEGNSGKTPFVFTVSLSNQTDQQVTVNFATADGSATVANNDYQPTSGTLTLPPKTSSGTVTVSVNGDVTQESAESFTVTLSVPVNATLGTAVGIGTILNDDASPSITIDDVKVTEGNSGKTFAVLTLHLSNPSASPVTTKVDYSTADGSATIANNDYQAASGTVTFPEKTTSATLTVAVNGDIACEPDETFFVNLANATNGSIADNQATVTINNDDDCVPPVVQVKFPNGGENFFIGTPIKILWNNTDTDRCTADILLARDGVNYNEVIVLGTPDDGSFFWNVTGPGTNTTAVPVFIAKIKVIAHDCASNTGEDTSDNGFSIYDIATSALLSVFEAQPFDEGGVELRWQLAADAQVTDVGLERGEGASGPWAGVTVESRVEGGVTVAVDRSAEYGKSYFYRLSGTVKGGERVVLGTLSSKAGERITEFALKRVYPNPTHGMVNVEYAVPRESKVALRVVDVAGRLVANLVDGVVRPGRYQAVWNGRGADGSRVGAGMYFVQFKAPGKNLVHRIVMAQ